MPSRSAPAAIETDFANTLAAAVRPEPLADAALVRTAVEIDGRRMALGLPAMLLRGLGSAAGTGAASEGTAQAPATLDPASIAAQISGTLHAWAVADGDAVAAGDTIGTMEAMKIEEMQVKAHRAGRVTLKSAQGAYISRGNEHRGGSVDQPGRTQAVRSTPSSAPGRGLEGIGKVLRLARHLPVPELHDAHGERALAFIVDSVFGDPSALTDDSPNHEPRRLARVMAAKRLQVVPAVDDFRRTVGYVAHGVVVIDLVFRDLITYSRGSPVPINGCIRMFLRFHRRPPRESACHGAE